MKTPMMRLGFCVLISLFHSGHAAPVAFDVPGTVPPLKQGKDPQDPNRSDNRCWAVCAAMLYSWKHNISVTPRVALQKSAVNYVTFYDNNKGLSWNSNVPFATAMKMKVEAPQNYSVAGWKKLLATHGPLWVSHFFPQSKIAWGGHARVITGIKGDGTPDGTFFTVLDPSPFETGPQKISVTMFVEQFEKIAREIASQPTPSELYPQVLHF